MLTIDNPKIVQAASQLTAVIPLRIPREDMQTMMGPAIAEVMGELASQAIEPAGPLFAHHLQVDPEVFDFEIGDPVPKPISVAGRVVSSPLPAGQVARTVYHGPHEGLPPTWEEFMAWITRESHDPAPNLWECYLTHPDSVPEPEVYQTELNRSIRP